MNGMLLRSLGRYIEEVNADVQSVVLNLTGTNKLHITQRDVFDEMDLSQQQESFETKIKVRCGVSSSITLNADTIPRPSSRKNFRFTT